MREQDNMRKKTLKNPSENVRTAFSPKLVGILSLTFYLRFLLPFKTVWLVEQGGFGGLTSQHATVVRKDGESTAEGAESCLYTGYGAVRAFRTGLSA